MGIQAQDDDYPDQVGTESQVLNTMTLTCLYVKKKSHLQVWSSEEKVWDINLEVISIHKAFTPVESDKFT